MQILDYFGTSKFYTGPMHSRKSARLIEELTTLQSFAEQFCFDIHVFQPRHAVRRSPDKLLKGINPETYIFSRGQAYYDTNVHSVDSSAEIISFYQQNHLDKQKHVIAIDEVHLFDSNILNVFEILSRHPDFYVVGAGLFLSFRGEPWVFPPDFKESMGRLKEMIPEDNWVELSALCQVCSRAANFTQRINKHREPEPYYAPLVQVGFDYEPRCDIHFETPCRRAYEAVLFHIETSPEGVSLTDLESYFVPRLGTKKTLSQILKTLTDEKTVLQKNSSFFPNQA